VKIERPAMVTGAVVWLVLSVLVASGMASTVWAVAAVIALFGIAVGLSVSAPWLAGASARLVHSHTHGKLETLRR
jgi:hypothetical protein